ncbi:hypothetical protein FRC12_007442 [Ceratobasidium sp. 428]|nr:hypothetical protein FRC12_007442 [Ceratobasidium sp. 428]
MSNQQPRPAKKSQFLPSQLSLRAAMGLLGRTSQSRSQSAPRPHALSVPLGVTPTPTCPMPSITAREPAITHGASTSRSPGLKIKTTTAPQGEEIDNLDSCPLMESRLNRGKGKMIQGDGDECVQERDKADCSGVGDGSTGESAESEESKDDEDSESDESNGGDDDDDDGDDEDDNEDDSDKGDGKGGETNYEGGEGEASVKCKFQATYEDEDELERDIAHARARFEKARQERDMAGGRDPIVKHNRDGKRRSIGTTGISSGSSVLKEMGGAKVEGFREGSVDTEVEKRLKAIERDHAYSCLMSLCNLKQAKDSAHLIPIYNENREPVYFDEHEFLIPHFDQPFDENFKVWGKRFYEVAADPTHMDEEHEDYLKTVPLKRFRDALPTGAFGTMATAWRNNWEGQGEAWTKKKNSVSRRSNRKIEKSKLRRAALDKSGLSTEAFGFITHPGFQSSEHSDPDDKSHVTIVSPEYRTLKVVELVDALDLQYNVTKKRSGNRVYTRVDCIKVNSKVPALKNPQMQVHKWAVDPGWMTANPDLERNSRPFIDSHHDMMPDEEEVERFIHDHEPDKRVYVSQDLHNRQPALPVPQSTQPVFKPASLPMAQDPLASALASTPAPSLTPIPAIAQELAEIPRYVPYDLPAQLNQFPQYIVRPPQGGQLPLPDDVGLFNAPPLNFMLGDTQCEPPFLVNNQGALDVSHPFNLPDRVDFQEMLADDTTPSAKLLPTQPQPSHNTPSSTSFHNTSDPTRCVDKRVEPPVEQVQPTRLSGRKRKASARAVEAAETAEASEESDTTVLKPKLSKAAKEKLKRKGKGKLQKQERVKASSRGHHSEEAATAGPSRIPFQIGNIKRISVKKLHGE